VVNSTVRNLGSVALGQSSSVISLKNNSFFETSVISFSQKSKMCSLFPWQHGISYLFEAVDLGSPVNQRNLLSCMKGKHIYATTFLKYPCPQR
jgi:hypothetical protein